MFPEINKLTLREKPFKYFYGTSNVKVNMLLKSVSWFKSHAPWKLIETDFYEQYEFSLFDVDLPDEVKYLISETTLNDLTNNVEAVFNIKLKKKVDAIAHKLVRGQTIRIHNDYLEGEESESHRVLLQLSDNWREDDGGYLMFFSSPETNNISDIVEPIGGSIQGFEISPTSFHAVSTVHKEERYTVVYSFYQK